MKRELKRRIKLGRELKRVPMNFDYPLGKTWYGYLNPYHPEACIKCKETGLSETAKLHYDIKMSSLDRKYLKNWTFELTQEDVIELIKKDRLQEFTRVPLNEEQKRDCSSDGLLKYNNGYIPTADEINEITKTSPQFFNVHDVYILIETRAKKDYGRQYGFCSYCNGEGKIYDSNESKELFEEWKKTQPPTGDGYQLWSTLSGSPTSPVFVTLDEMCEWCVAYENNNIFDRDKPTKNEWEEILTCDDL